MAPVGRSQLQRRSSVLPLLAAAAAAVAALRSARHLGRGFVAAARSSSASAAPKGLAAEAVATSASSARRSSLIAGLGAALLGEASPDVARAEQKKKPLVVTFKVELEGDQGGEGEVKVRLHPEWAPRGVRRFKELVRMGEFEDSAVFHVSKKTAHFGLPAKPTLIPDHIKDDFVRVGNRRGTLTFNQDGGRVNQLFFNTADNDRMLDLKGYAPIGEVLEGMDIVDGFYSGYGTRPSRLEIKMQGNEYLDKQFPKLSKIKSVEIEA